MVFTANQAGRAGQRDTVRHSLRGTGSCSSTQYRFGREWIGGTMDGESVDLADFAPRIGALLMEKWLLEIRLQRLAAEKATVPLDVKADEDLVAVDGHLES